MPLTIDSGSSPGGPTKKPLTIYFISGFLMLLIRDQLPLAPPVLIGFFMAPEDLVLDFAINFEAPACARPLLFLEAFFASVFLLMWNPIKYNCSLS